MADAKRRKTVSTSFNNDGTASVSLYTAPDASGAQGIAETLSFDEKAISDKLFSSFAVRGVLATFANIYNRIENPSATQLHDCWTAFASQVADGSFEFGRHYESEPDDLVLAVAEVTQQPVHVVQQQIDNLLAEPAKLPDGSDRRDKAGRIVHVWGKAKLYKAIEDGTPGVKAAVAKLIAERARRLAAEAKSGKLTGAIDLFARAAQ